MIIYNVTSKVEHSIAKEWIEWMRREHLPEVLSTGCFTDYQIARLLEIDEEDGPTYAIQYYAHSLEEYNKYIATFAPVLRKKNQERWGDKCLSIRTLMEIVN